MTRFLPVLLALLPLLPHPSLVAAEEDRPNVLLIVADDLNTRVGPYLEPGLEVHTPNLDRLASEGVLFTRAYSQFPLCGPSRASFMAGMYPESIRVLGNSEARGNHRKAHPGLANHPSLAGFFRENGYYAARVSKVFHMGVPGGIERGDTGPDDPESWDWTYNVLAPETLSPGVLENLSDGKHYGVNFARIVLEDGTEDTQADVLAANQAIALLENRAKPVPPGATNRVKPKAEAPFFLAVGFVRPHVPLIAPARHFAPYPEESAPLPVVPEGDLDDVPEQAGRNHNNVYHRMNETEKRRAIVAYHASISFMDEQVGRLLDALDRLGLRDETIVVFISDHGFNLGEHDCWQKFSLWEESVRVPMIIAAPGGAAGGQADAMVELVDLYPTLAGLAGLETKLPEKIQGENLARLVATPAEGDGAGVAYTITGNGGASIRTERWRYTRWGEEAAGANEELYDHAVDPGEHTNLARDPAHTADLEALRALFESARTRAREGA